MAQQPSSGFDFQQYLRKQDGGVHPVKPLPQVSQADVAYPHPMPASRMKAMHDHLMEHRIDGYQRPWVRSVKDILNAERLAPAKTKTDKKRKAASENHWDAMHQSMHDFNRNVLQAVAETPNELGYITHDEAVVKHWETIHRQIEYFNKTYPEQMITSLPTRAEFMGALPELLEPLIAVKPHNERDHPPNTDNDQTAGDLERARLAQTRGSLNQSFVAKAPKRITHIPTPVTIEHAPVPPSVDSLAGMAKQLREALETTPIPGEQFAWYADIQREYGMRCNVLDEAIQHPENDKDLQENLSKELDMLMEHHKDLDDTLDALAKKLVDQRVRGMTTTISMKDYQPISGSYGMLWHSLPEQQKSEVASGHQVRGLREAMQGEASRALDKIIGPLPPGTEIQR